MVHGIKHKVQRKKRVFVGWLGSRHNCESTVVLGGVGFFVCFWFWLFVRLEKRTLNMNNIEIPPPCSMSTDERGHESVFLESTAGFPNRENEE